MYRRQFLIDNSLLFKEGLYHEDILFTPKALVLSQNTVCRDILVVDYRTGRDGAITSRTTAKHLTDKRDTARELFSFFAAHKLQKETAGRYVLGIYLELIESAIAIGTDPALLLSADDHRTMRACALTRHDRNCVRLFRVSPAYMIAYHHGRINPLAKKMINLFFR